MFFSHNYHQNYQNYHHNYHWNHHYHHQKKFRSYAQNVVFDVQKRGPSCPNWGQGGGVRGFGQCPKENVFFYGCLPLSKWNIIHFLNLPFAAHFFALLLTFVLIRIFHALGAAGTCACGFNASWSPRSSLNTWQKISFWCLDYNNCPFDPPSESRWGPIKCWISQSKVLCIQLWQGVIIQSWK